MNVNSGYPGSRYVHPATRDDPSVFTPTAAVFREAAQPWDHVDPALSQRGLPQRMQGEPP